MTMKIGVLVEVMGRPSQFMPEALVEQILWLIKIRWLVVAVIIVAGLIGTYFHKL